MQAPALPSCCPVCARPISPCLVWSHLMQKHPESEEGQTVQAFVAYLKAKYPRGTTMSEEEE